MVSSREVHLKSRPKGMPVADNFEVATVSVPDPAPGEVQVRNLWMSVDPYMRNRMADRARDVPPRDDRISQIAASNATMFGWRPPFQLGEVLQGGAIGEVVASNDQSLMPGDVVSTWLGWREVFNAPAGTLEKLDTFGLPLETLLGVAGMTGLTAWVGLLKIATLKPGDVVFVSAASGAVGSVACQIAKIKGHTVIGSAGGAENARSSKRSVSTTSSTTKQPATSRRPCFERLTTGSMSILTMLAASTLSRRLRQPTRSPASRFAG